MVVRRPRLNWEDARSSCQRIAANADLASVGDEIEAAHISAIDHTRSRTEPMWLGGRIDRGKPYSRPQSLKDRVGAWVDGTPVPAPDITTMWARGAVSSQMPPMCTLANIRIRRTCLVNL